MLLRNVVHVVVWRAQVGTYVEGSDDKKEEDQDEGGQSSEKGDSDQGGRGDKDGGWKGRKSTMEKCFVEFSASPRRYKPRGSPRNNGATSLSTTKSRSDRSPKELSSGGLPNFVPNTTMQSPNHANEKTSQKAPSPAPAPSFADAAEVRTNLKRMEERMDATPHFPAELKFTSVVTT